MTKAVVRDPSRSSGVRVIEVPDPGPPGPGQVRVRMLMAPVNPADRMAVAGSYAAGDGLPETIGAEGIGIVEDVGEGVTAARMGERVMLMSRGNWTTERLVPAGEVMPVSGTLADAQAAMLRINPATAFRLLEQLSLPGGAWLIQNAAASSVARWVRVLAARRGIRTVNVVRGGHLDAGGEPVLVESVALAAAAAAATGGEPIAAALDAVAGEATGRLAECLRSSGELLVYGHLSGQPCSIPSTLLTTQGLTVRGFSLRPAEADEDAERRRQIYTDLTAILAESPEPVSAVYGLDEIVSALAASAAPGRRGRVLLALGR